MIWSNIFNILQFWAGYLFFICLLPAVCLYKIIAKKPWIFRMAFYQVCGNLYLIGGGFLLSYLRIFGRWSLWVLVLLPLGIKAYLERKRFFDALDRWNETKRDLSLGVYGNRRFAKDIRNKLFNCLKKLYRSYLKGNWAEIIMVLAVLVFVIGFFGEYKFTSSAYGHTDEETHLYWIQSLVKNNVFPVGMYPHGMHFLTAEISLMMDISPVATYLNFSVSSTVLVFLAFYFFMRTALSSRSAAWIGWAIFTVCDIFHSVTYFRYQFSFPMEFGLVSFAFMFMGLIYYIREKDRGSWWLFVLSLTWSFQAHFYVTIFAGIICVAFGIVFLVKMLRERILHKVLAGGILGLIIAVLPFGIGYLKGYEFERSIGWALGIMEGRDMSDEFQTAEDMAEPEEEKEDSKEDTGPAYSLSAIRDANSGMRTMVGILTDACIRKGASAKFILVLFAGTLIYGILGLIFSREKEKYLLYLFLALAWGLTAVLYSCHLVGLPALVEMYRAASFLAIMTALLFAMPFQLLYDLCRWGKVPLAGAEWIVLAAGGLGIGALAAEDKLKWERYYEITATEADMQTCMRVMEEYEDQKWTIISPTNDVSAIINNGFHYEIMDLVDKLDEGKKEIYIPTPYIFVVVENQVMRYYESKRMIDRSDVITYTLPVSKKEALTDLDIPDEGSDGRDRLYYFNRPTLMSKLYYWMEKIKQVFPNAVSVYYEDECCTVYKLEQDEYFLLNLALDYQEGLK